MHRNSFKPHRTFALNGVKQILKNLIKTNRRFTLLPTDGWIVLWEKAGGTEFADPNLTKWLSQDLSTDAIWIYLVVDFNIWSCQSFRNGKLLYEVFKPTSYFLGESSPVGRSHVSCMTYAKRFQAKQKLPCFLTTLARLEKSKRMLKSTHSIVVRLPESKGVVRRQGMMPKTKRQTIK
jgi:hypothetical protein